MASKFLTNPEIDGPVIINTVEQSGQFVQTVNNIAPDATGNVTVAGGGGGGALNDLSDVTIAGPVNTQVLTYSGGIWSNQAATGGATQLNDLSDVNLVGLSSNNIMLYNGASWGQAIHEVSSMIDVDSDVIPRADGHALLWNNATLRYENRPIVAADIADVASHIADTSIHYTQASINVPIDQLSDVNDAFNTPSNGDILYRQEGVYTNVQNSIGLCTDVDDTGITEGQGLRWSTGLQQYIPVDLGSTITIPASNVKLDTKFNNNYTDDGIDALTAIPINTPTFVSGKLNQALFCDHLSNQYVHWGDNLGFDINQAFSFEFWLYPFSTSPTGDRWILGKGLNTTSPGYNMTYNRNTFDIEFTMRVLVGNRLYLRWTNTNLNDGWHHIVLTKTASSNDFTSANLYVDSMLNNTKSVLNDTLVSSIANTDNFTVGSGSGGNAYISAYIDNLRVYDIALTQAAIEGFYNNNIGTELMSFSSNILSGLDDVQATLPIDDSNILVFSSLLNKWTNVPNSLELQPEMLITTPYNDKDALIYNTGVSRFENRPIVSADIADVASHIADTSIHYTQASIIVPIDQLSDVTITSAIADDTLVYSGSQWVNQPIVKSLNDLSDVQLTGGTLNDILVYDTGLSTYKNRQLVEADISDLAHKTTIDSLDNVIISAPADTEVLTYSGGIWSNASPGGVSYPLFAPVGTTTPQYSFDTQTTTGIGYFSNSTFFNHQGVQYLNITNGNVFNITSGSYVQLPVQTGSGSVGGSFWFDGTWKFKNTGGAIVQPGTAFPILADNGSSAAPSYSFANNPDSGFYHLSSIPRLSYNAVETMELGNPIRTKVSHHFWTGSNDNNSIKFIKNQGLVFDGTERPHVEIDLEPYVYTAKAKTVVNGYGYNSLADLETMTYNLFLPRGKELTSTMQIAVHFSAYAPLGTSTGVSFQLDKDIIVTGNASPFNVQSIIHANNVTLTSESWTTGVFNSTLTDSQTTFDRLLRMTLTRTASTYTGEILVKMTLYPQHDQIGTRSHTSKF